MPHWLHIHVHVCTNIPYLEELHQLHVMSIDIEYSLCGHPYKRSVGGFALSVKNKSTCIVLHA